MFRILLAMLAALVATAPAQAERVKDLGNFQSPTSTRRSRIPPRS